jgi:hypothetical protein
MSMPYMGRRTSLRKKVYRATISTSQLQNEYALHGTAPPDAKTIIPFNGFDTAVAT